MSNLMKAFRVGISLWMACAGTGIYAAWNARDAATTANLWGAAYRSQQPGEPPGGVLVVVGERGTILTSADEGNTWVARLSGTTAWLTAVTHDSRLNLFLAVGDGGVILSSPDGITWRREASPTTVRLNGVALGGTDRAVWAVGEAGAGLLSRDAHGVWSQSDAGFGGRWMRGVMSSVAVGQGGAIFSAEVDDTQSPAVVRWRRESLSVTSDIEAVSAGDFFGGLPVAVGADGLVLHRAGPERTWITRASGTRARLRGVCYKSGGFVRLITATLTVGLGEFFAVGTGGVILRSADGVAWQTEPAETPRNLNAVVSTANAVVAVGDGGTILATGGSGALPLISRPPVFAYDESDQPILEGIAAGDGALSYLWVQLNAGAPRPVGTTPRRQPLPALTVSGVYQLIVANAFGLVRSEPVAPHPLLNLSSRAMAGAGDNTLITGFSISSALATNDRMVLIRAVGPALGNFGVGNFVPAPRLTVYAGSRVIASNQGWQNQPEAFRVESAGARIGAFPLPAGSRDSAVVLTLTEGNYTALVESSDGRDGIALVEVYDLAPPNLARLTNLAARANVQDGNGVFIGGLVIGGGLRKTVLLRAAGPALRAFGLSPVLASPRLTLYRGTVAVATAGAWSTAANAGAIRSATGVVNAFAFAEGSADAAMLRELEPGAYTLHVTGDDGDRGVSLVEVYEVR